MASNLVTMCSQCRAVKIKDETNRWIRYKLFSRHLYEKIINKCDGLIYGYCPECLHKIRKIILL